MAALRAPWAHTALNVASALDVSVTVGLSEEAVELRRAQYGFNELAKELPTPMWKLIAAQFDDTLVKILMASAGVSFALAWFDESAQDEGLRAFVEPLVILLILVLNSAVGVWQESRSEAALDALKDLQSEHARVLRGGKQISDLLSRELVPGDVVELHVGDRVPADMRVITLRTAVVRIEQASLTGESVAVSKRVEPVEDESCEIQAKECMLFSGTAIASGIVIGIVTATGMDTEIGKIQSQIKEASEEEDVTPLKKKLNEFGEMLARVIFIICVLVWLINYRNFLTFDPLPGDWPFPVPNPSSIKVDIQKMLYYLKIAVALAVAAIPEGLPAVITTCLALGTRTMAKKNAIVRKLPSVETLGCTTVICSDKTGTLTTNQMSVVQLCTLGGSSSALRVLEVTGHTYNPVEGAVLGISSLDAVLQALAKVCAVCNEGHVECKAGVFRAVGAPTEAALKVLVEKLATSMLEGAACQSLEEHPEPVCDYFRERSPVLSLLEFDRDRKSMSVLVDTAGGKELLVKGAAECVLERCTKMMLPNGSVVTLSPVLRSAVLKQVEVMAEAALRCLAIALKTDLGVLSSYNNDSKHPGHALLLDPSKYSLVESDLVFVGLLGLHDPPRPQVAGAIQECRQAGIRVMVITGDNKKTAEAICEAIGVLAPGQMLTDKSFTGRDFMSLPRESQLRILKNSQSLVFSRAEPKHKQDIVRLLKELGEVVAMTGDGVNDAPALKLADIGIAMGISGTEVAKEASDMVLADDNFSSIVAAVAEGRSIYNNMKAFIRYMISSNIGEVASIFLTAALGLPEGLIPVQLLWVNLVTDGPPATALGFNKADSDIMQKPPRKSNEMLITPWVFFRYMVVGMYVGMATVGAFVAWYMYDNFMGIDLSKDGHTTVSWYQLSHWQSCSTWQDFAPTNFTAGGVIIELDGPCDYFEAGKTKAMTLSLSVLVMIEMLNALNALSEDASLLVMPPWTNVYLLLAIFVSISLHCMIMYLPFFASIFSIVPLSWLEWQLVLLWSFPVIVIDELLKLLARVAFGTRKVKVKTD